MLNSLQIRFNVVKKEIKRYLNNNHPSTSLRVTVRLRVYLISLGLMCNDRLLEPGCHFDEERGEISVISRSPW